MLQMFYHLVVASVVFYAVVFWGFKIRAADTNRINKLIRKPGSKLGMQSDLKKLLTGRMLQKLISINDNAAHPVHHTVLSYSITFSQRPSMCNRRSQEIYFSLDQSYCTIPPLSVRSGSIKPKNCSLLS